MRPVPSAGTPARQPTSHCSECVQPQPRGLAPSSCLPALTSACRQPRRPALAARRTGPRPLASPCSVRHSLHVPSHRVIASRQSSIDSTGESPFHVSPRNPERDLWEVGSSTSSWTHNRSALVAPPARRTRRGFWRMPPARGSARGEVVSQVDKDKAFRDRLRIENNLRLHRQAHPVRTARTLVWWRVRVGCVRLKSSLRRAGVGTYRAGGEGARQSCWWNHPRLLPSAFRSRRCAAQGTQARAQPAPSLPPSAPSLSLKPSVSHYCH